MMINLSACQHRESEIRVSKKNNLKKWLRKKVTREKERIFYVVFTEKLTKEKLPLFMHELYSLIAVKNLDSSTDFY